MKPYLIILTGTNGVGKSTFGSNLQKDLKIPFIDLDMFYKQKFGAYRQYTQEEIIEASRELDILRQGYFQNHQSFVMERIIQTPQSVEKLLQRAKNYGFSTSLFYIGAENPIEASESRINDRVTKGLHFVDADTIKNNLKDVTDTFKIIAPKFDNIVIYDNSKNYETAKRVLDIRNQEIYLAKELPRFAQELIKDTFIEEKLKAKQQSFVRKNR
ncbi:hypothetical protein BKH41_08800 [Helicobacter sp. 12S02232-10]|uniref:zeta toxin family protein n=1 Tax=Helicobacter sp. 12S02232-10 TaxID=1476197 RepID=UPI000BA7DCB6|nr:zeta toxin family protein [Helicobacter sp. 12S02232-10]PAF46593.1 hypothetical protein BKH41_08800 [Helicobacter sp. 12S02232-10]